MTGVATATQTDEDSQTVIYCPVYYPKPLLFKKLRCLIAHIHVDHRKGGDGDGGGGVTRTSNVQR